MIIINNTHRFASIIHTIIPNEVRTSERHILKSFSFYVGEANEQTSS